MQARALDGADGAEGEHDRLLASIDGVPAAGNEREYEETDDPDDDEVSDATHGAALPLVLAQKLRLAKQR
jgi:hypothetical protein